MEHQQPPQVHADHRRATAERNVEKILDAAAALLARGAAASTTAVAIEAGVSRVTVYAHFPTREALIEAVAERAVRRAAVAANDARLDEGSALDALDRLVAVAWDHLDRGGAIARAAGDQLTAEAAARVHTALRAPIAALVARGQAEGAFRTDLPSSWMISSYFALMHACGEEVRGGTLDPADAVGVLQPTLRAVFAG
ncbi:MAG TPA: TetR/AcrR family transcriptional regulator [Baekduia sp.]|nr:TetR/AcrR family transcriptional regulator [Baekduia sp.]